MLINVSKPKYMLLYYPKLEMGVSDFMSCSVLTFHTIDEVYSYLDRRSIDYDPMSLMELIEANPRLYIGICPFHLEATGVRQLIYHPSTLELQEDFENSMKYLEGI